MENTKTMGSWKSYAFISLAAMIAVTAIAV